MRKIRWLSTAMAAVVVGAVLGCGSENAVSSGGAHADAWIGRFTGEAEFRVTSGQTGVSDDVELTITRISAGRISVAAVVGYLPTGATRAQDAYAIGALVPSSPDTLRQEVRSGTQRILFELARTASGIEADISTSNRRYDGGWVLEQRFRLRVD